MTSKPIYFCVYRITNLVEKKHYYGFKSSSIHPSKVIGVTYFSSLTKDEGKAFRKDQKENPQNYKYKIVQLFDTKEKALTREVRLHAKFDVENCNNFFNKRNQKSSRFDNTGHNHTEETKVKISISKKGKSVHTAESKAKISAAHKGKCHTTEHNAKVAISNKGKKRSEETKAKISISKKGKTHPGIVHTEETKAKMSAAHIKFLYNSPIGVVNDARDLEPIIKSKALRNWCNNPDKIISKGSYVKSKYLHENYNIDIIGKTFRELGFYKMPNVN